MTSDEKAVEDAFARLAANLKITNFPGDPETAEKSTRAMAKIREAYTALKDADFRLTHAEKVKAEGEPFTPDQLKPFLGHVCVAAGIISYQDLMDAVSKQTDIDLPLGQILQDRGLLSQTELDGMLMGQKLYGAPNRPIELIVKRLLALGMVNMDMVKIALIDQRTSMDSLDELLCKRGWLSKNLVDAFHKSAV